MTCVVSISPWRRLTPPWPFQNQSERRAERRDAADFQKGGFMTLDSVGDVDEEEGARGRDAAAAEDDEPQTSATEKLAELPDYDGKHAVGTSGSCSERWRPLCGVMWQMVWPVGCLSSSKF